MSNQQLFISDEVRADLVVVERLNAERLALESAMDAGEAGTPDYEAMISEWEAVQTALASSAIDLLESLTGQR